MKKANHNNKGIESSNQVERWFCILAFLSLVKLSNPVDLAEYVERNNLSSESAFNWWFKWTLAKRASLIAKFKAKRKKGKIKFEIKFLDTVEEALELYSMNGDKLWQEAITKERNNSRFAFQVLDADDQPPIWLNIVVYFKDKIRE